MLPAAKRCKDNTKVYEYNANDLALYTGIDILAHVLLAKSKQFGLQNFYSINMLARATRARPTGAGAGEVWIGLNGINFKIECLLSVSMPHLNSAHSGRSHVTKATFSTRAIQFNSLVAETHLLGNATYFEPRNSARKLVEQSSLRTRSWKFCRTAAVLTRCRMPSTAALSRTAFKLYGYHTLADALRRSAFIWVKLKRQQLEFAFDDNACGALLYSSFAEPYSMCSRSFRCIPRRSSRTSRTTSARK